MKQQPAWRRKIVRSMGGYYRNVLYLFVFFEVFTIFRRLILAQHDLGYLHYGMPIVSAMVLAKIIMIGDALHLSRGLEDKPLIVPALYKAVLFSLLVFVFKVVETLARALLSGKGLAGGLEAVMSKNTYELLAEAMVMFLAFLPFFAIRELARVLGRDRLARLFFGGRGEQADDGLAKATPGE